jgi:ABC-2 type transport system ATP-binding protein
VQEKRELMRKLGKKQLVIELQRPLDVVPDPLQKHALELAPNGTSLTFTYDTQADRTGITALLADMREADIGFKDLATSQSSLEDIFVDLVRQSR